MRILILLFLVSAHLTAFAQSASVSSNFLASTKAFVNESVSNSSSKVIYLFELGGQSNSIGWGGTNSLAPTPIAGTWQWTSNNGVRPLDLTYNPIGGEYFGNSIIPQFANTYRTLTGRDVGFVMGVDLGSVTQTAAADVGKGNFDVTGTLRAPMVSRYLQAKTNFQAAGYTVIMSGILWMQGDTDALSIPTGVITQQDYITAATNMIAYYRANLGADLPFYFIRIGVNTNFSDVGPNAIRDAQEIIVASDPRSRMVYRDTDKFLEYGWLTDYVHYNQTGLNAAGMGAALTLCGVTESAPNISTTGVIPGTYQNSTITVGSDGRISSASSGSGGGGGSGYPELISTLQADFNFTATNAADSGLSVFLETNSTYTVSAFLNTSCSGSGGFYWAFSSPASSAYSVQSFGQTTSPTTFARALSTIDTLIGVGSPFNATAGNGFVILEGTIETTSGGFLKIRGAAKTQGQSNTFKRLGSKLIVKKVL